MVRTLPPNNLLVRLNSGRLARYTLLTACFSPETAGHILFNGFTFYFMAPLVISILGNVGFLGLYLGITYLGCIHSGIGSDSVLLRNRRCCIQSNWNRLAESHARTGTSTRVGVAWRKRRHLLRSLLLRLPRTYHKFLHLWRSAGTSMGRCYWYLPLGWLQRGKSACECMQTLARIRNIDMHLARWDRHRWTHRWSYVGYSFLRGQTL